MFSFSAFADVFRRIFGFGQSGRKQVQPARVVAPLLFSPKPPRRRREYKIPTFRHEDTLTPRRSIYSQFKHGDLTLQEAINKMTGIPGHRYTTTWAKLMRHMG